MSQTFRIERSDLTIEAWSLALRDLDDETIQQVTEAALRQHNSVYITPAQFRGYLQTLREKPDGTPRNVL